MLGLIASDDEACRQKYFLLQFNITGFIGSKLYAIPRITKLKQQVFVRKHILEVLSMLAYFKQSKINCNTILKHAVMSIPRTMKSS